ncbi:protein spaetzle 5-like [Chironomus tepperi]|uniref:protein spaetzle 5-like n=1 Tax=Chironomus tepperi TaxID=113505 RepID=UPI00391F8C8D
MRTLLLSLLFLSALFSCNAIICNFTYEEQMSNYPEKLINSIAAEKKVLLKLSTKPQRSKAFVCDDGDDDGYKHFEPTIHSVLVSSRFGSSAKEVNPLNDSSEANDQTEPLCESTRSRIFPQTLRNLQNKMVIVVNHGKLHQEVTIETCSNADQPCMFDINFPINVMTKCKQKYLIHTVKVLNENNQTIVDESVYVPSGCECRFKYKSLN